MQPGKHIVFGAIYQKYVKGLHMLCDSNVHLKAGEGIGYFIETIVMQKIFGKNSSDYVKNIYSITTLTSEILDE